MQRFWREDEIYVVCEKNTKPNGQNCDIIIRKVFCFTTIELEENVLR